MAVAPYIPAFAVTTDNLETGDVNVALSVSNGSTFPYTADIVGVPAGDPAPSVAQVRLGQKSDASAAPIVMQLAISIAGQQTINKTGVATGTYDFYATVKDDSNEEWDDVVVDTGIVLSLNARTFDLVAQAAGAATFAGSISTTDAATWSMATQAEGAATFAAVMEAPNVFALAAQAEGESTFAGVVEAPIGLDMAAQAEGESTFAATFNVDVDIVLTAQAAGAAVFSGDIDTVAGSPITFTDAHMADPQTAFQGFAEGDLLLVQVIARNGSSVSAAGITDSMGSDQWALAFSEDNELGDPDHRVSTGIFYRPAVAGDVGNTITTSVTGITAARRAFWVSPSEAVTWGTPVAVSAGSGTADDWDGTATGASSSIAGPKLVIHGGAGRTQSSLPTTVTLNGNAADLRTTGTNGEAFAYWVNPTAQGTGTISTTLASDGADTEGIAFALAFPVS